MQSGVLHRPVLLFACMFFLIRWCSAGEELQKVPVVPTHPRIAFRKDDLARLRRQCLTTHAKEYALLKASADRAVFLDQKPVAPGLLFQLANEARYLAFATSDYDAFHEVLPPDQRQRLANAILHKCRKSMTVDAGIGNVTRSLQVSHTRTAILPILRDAVPIARQGEMEKRLKWLGQRVQEMRQIYNTIAASRGGKATSFHCACFYGRMPNFFEAWRVLTGEDYFGDPLLSGFLLQPMHHTLPFRHNCADMTNSWGHDHLGRPADYILASRVKDGLCQWVIHNPEWVTARRVGKHDPADFDGLGRAWEKGLRGLAGYKETQWSGPVAYWWGHMPSRILYYDPTLGEVAPEALPTSALFDGLGQVCMRSSWQDDATFVRLHSGPNFRGEPPHLNDNTFVLYHKGWLVTPEASTGKLTSCASSILVKDPEETIICTGNYTGGLDWNAVWNGRLSDLRPSPINDGGQSYWKPTVNRLDAKVRGKIMAYQADDLFTYAVGDATQSYNPKKLKSFTRQFLYLKPGLVVIFDRVVSTKANFEKRWVVHTKGKPRMLADGKTIMADAVSRALPNHTRGYDRTPYFEKPVREKGPPETVTLIFETLWDGMDVGLVYDRDPTVGELAWSLDTNKQTGELNQKGEKQTFVHADLAKNISRGKHTLVLRAIKGNLKYRYFSVNLGGRLFATTLLPADTEREITPNKQAKVEPYHHKADWRVDVIAKTSRTDDVFLHVLEATDRSQEKPTAVQTTEAQDHVALSFAYAGKQYTVRFDRQDAVAAHLRIKEQDKTLVEKALPLAIKDTPDAHLERCGQLRTAKPLYDYAVRDIVHLAPQAKADALTSALKDKRWAVRFYALRALAMKGEAGLATHVRPLLKDPDGRVAGIAAETLGRLGAQAAENDLVAALKSPESELRLYAAWALGELKSAKSVTELSLLLADKNGFVRSNAAEALGKIKSQAAAEALSKALDRETSAHMKAAHLWALSQIGGEVATRRLAEMLKHEDKTLRACAVAGLKQALGNKAEPHLRRCLQDEDKGIQAFARRALAEFGATDILTAFLTTAQDPKVSFKVRAGAIQHLASCKYVPALEPLAKLLTDEKSQARSTDAASVRAALALHVMGDPRGRAYLKKAAVTGDKPHLMTGAARALQQFSKAEAVPILMQALEQVKKTKGLGMKKDPLGTILSSLFKLTQEHPGAELQVTDWTRIHKEAAAWQAWWQKQKESGK